METLQNLLDSSTVPALTALLLGLHLHQRALGVLRGGEDHVRIGSGDGGQRGGEDRRLQRGDGNDSLTDGKQSGVEAVPAVTVDTPLVTVAGGDAARFRQFNPGFPADSSGIEKGTFTGSRHRLQGIIRASSALPLTCSTRLLACSI